MMSHPQLEAALSYAARGWRVFPCHHPLDTGGCSCRRDDCGSIGKHPCIRDWGRQATTDPDVIKGWWGRWSNANIAVVTGAASGLVVLDKDPDHGGDDSLAELEAQYGALPETPQVLTGGGGTHDYFAYPSDPIGNSAGRLGHGLDIRGEGGYVIAPPSRHVSGRQYEWELSSHPDDVPLAPLPDWLLSLIRTPTLSVSAADPSEPISDGKRNDTLFRIACSWRGKGLSVSEIEAALLVTNAERCQPPLDDAEVKRIAASTARYEQGWEDDLFSHNSLFAQPEFPELDDAALHGLAGEIVRLIEPETESSAVAILVQFLVSFGVVVGRRPYYLVEATQHRANLFCAVVGDSSKSRKGTSAGRVRRIFEMADEGFARDHWVSGLSSGEGLIWAVRDPIYKRERGKKKDDPPYQEVVVDPGVTDKRLLVMESEFAQVLKVMTREGNILSPIIRQAWDSGNLRTMTKNSPAKATGAHIGIVGHITSAELQRLLTETEAANGFGNRILWICARRARLLPDGGNLSEDDLKPLAKVLHDTLTTARAIQQLRRDADANRLWHDRYNELSQDRPGLLGALCARAEAQVLRLSCLYALLDQSATINRAHLEAALAVWDYAEDSVRYLFGDVLGDPLADEILRLLRQRPDGLSRTDISNNFGRHRKGGEIGAALRRLQRQGLAYCVMKGTGGRPGEVWHATRPSTPPSTKTSPSPDTKPLCEKSEISEKREG